MTYSKLWMGAVVGTLALAATGCGDGGQRTAKIADLDPYVGRYPPAIRSIPPMPTVATPTPPKVVNRSLNGATIVIDAGHGGHDPGARGLSSTSEKNINLSIAMLLRQALQSRGARVVATRTGDTFIELESRAAMADRNGADLFISLHADSSKKSDISGTTIYVARGAANQSRQAAQCIAAAMNSAGIECRGIHEAGFRVLKGHSRPAVLVECGFLTNRGDARALNSSSYQSRVAQAIADGVARHFSN